MSTEFKDGTCAEQTDWEYRQSAVLELLCALLCACTVYAHDVRLYTATLCSFGT